MATRQICILYGNPQPNHLRLTGYVDKLAAGLARSHQVDLFRIDDMDIHYCTGCWSCWWKTPGECAFRDDAAQIFRSVMQSDLLIFASPVMAGFTSSSLKKITDRFVTLIHPYIQVVKGEYHHRKRYKKYPPFGLLLENEADTDAQDETIIRDMYDRLAINFHTRNLFLNWTHQQTAEELVNEIGTV
jgi:multimeric flavodoxin WrbA